MASAGTVTLELDANSVKLLRELQKTQKQTKGAAKGMQKSFGDAFTQIRKGIDTTVKAFGGLAIAATAATAAIFKGATTAAREIRVLSQTANTNAQEFQRMAFGAEMFGISQEKLSDILKDTTDRVGDFIQTGGGPMADFFEKIAPKVGVTADQFAKLSGKDALQLFVNSLEAANLSQADMVFYMEAIASDSTRLLPLLSGNGRELGKFADQADRLGIVLDDLDIGQLEAANRELNAAFAVLESARNDIAVGIAPAVSELANAFVEAGEAAGGMSNYINDGLRSVAKAGAWVSNIFHGWKLIIAGLRVVFGESVAFIMRVFRTLGATIEFVITAGRAGWSALIELMLKGVRAALQGVEDFANGAINRINMLIGLANKIPSVDIDLIGKATFESIESLDNAIKIASGTANKFKGDLIGMARQPLDNGAVNEFFNGFLNHVDATVEHYKDQFLTMAAGRIPTDEVDAFFDNIKQKSQEAGAVVAASMSGQGAPIKPTGEEGEEGYWQKWLASAEKALTSADDMAKNTIETFTTGFGQAFESMIFDSENFGDAMRNLFVDMGRVVVRTLGQMAAEWLAYQLVQMVVGKTTKAAAASGMVAIAQAQSLQAGLNAFASTAAIPIVGPAAAPAAMGAALAVTQPIAASIGALSLAGMAHDGIDSVPREGTWLLDKGERVMTADTSAKLDKKLDMLAGGGNSAIINVYGDAQVRRGGIDPETRREIINIMVGEAQPGGRLHKSITTNTTATTRTR